MGRRLTRDEIALLLPIFKGTLNYGNIRCEINQHDVGGIDNSITPAGVPHFSKLRYCEDFSRQKAPKSQWLFIHEMTHVWQWGHGIYPVWAAAGEWVANLGKYKEAYGYALTPGKKLSDFSLEQQASIVADYWTLQSRRMPTCDNNNIDASVDDYAALIAELQKSGPAVSKLEAAPRWP